MINLEDFCSTEPEGSLPSERLWIRRPFSRGEYTYATNGHVMVRLPRQEAFPERADAPSTEKLEQILFSYEADFLALPRIELPAPEEIDCAECDGTGWPGKHDCPHCKCDRVACDECGGTGKVPARPVVLVRGVPFQTGYVRQLLALPGIEVPREPKAGNPMPFRFTGGVGALMPLRADIDDASAKA